MTPSLSIRSHILHPFGWRWLGFLPVLALLFGVAAFLSRPAVTVSPGQSSLAVVRMGWLNRLERVTVTANGRRIPAVVEGTRVVPLIHLAPGTVVVVATSVSAPSWNPFGTVTDGRLRVVVPPNPVLTARTVTVPLGHAVVVPLSGPAAVAYVRLGTDTGWTTLVGPGRHLRVGPPEWRPGVSGVVEVRTRARPWERSSQPQLLAWRSVPWLKATIETSADAPSSVTVVFSAAVVPGAQRFFQWTPSLSGRWRRLGPTRFAFAPTSEIWPDASYTLAIAGGPRGVRTTTGSYLPGVLHLTWTAPNGSLLRLQQVLAQLEYLPVEWQPTGTPLPNTLSAQIQAAYAPPAGTFTWRYPNVPPTLAALWQPGVDTVMTTGAVMAFERQNGLPVDGQVGPAVWKALIEAALADHVNPHGYSYVYVSETLPERLTIWHNGQIVLTSLANTGIPQSPTYLGTSPVYLRYVSQTMSGINPNGTPYVDPGVPWVNYFAGGDAVHGFVRAQYGFPQSLGCVELPIPEAAIAWTYIHYGTLVTVEPPGSPSLP